MRIESGQILTVAQRWLLDSISCRATSQARRLSLGLALHLLSLATPVGVVGNYT